MNPLPPFEYCRPSTVAEACALLAAPGAVALAGGTDLLVHWRAGRRAAARVVSLRGLPELAGIHVAPDGHARIGARTDLQALIEHPGVRERFPVLRRAARVMGSPAVRQLATVGGNCCNASPAADLAPPLLALDAAAEIVGPGRVRTMPLRDFFTGPGATVLAPGELLAAVTLPARAGRWHTAYQRLDVRRAMDIALASVAASLRMEGGRVVEARIALGAVAPVPLRATAAESALVHRTLDEAALAAAAQAAMAQARPITDLRATAEYRRAMVGVLVRRALEACGRATDEAAT